MTLAIRSVFVAFILSLTACALLPASPEQQIRTGANSVTSSANLTTALLQRKKITVAQAKDYREMMRTARGTLETANATLVDCRARTGSTQKSAPDPCKTNIVADIDLATSILSQIEATLKAKE